ncbi:MAG: helix-turn-helix transcriptional regulator [Chloroflexota bacterium]|nr:helix-turn-helix transcriptional regulator [Chloroflexota bacterium]
MESNAVTLQLKIIGVLMRAAREKSRRTLNEVAQRLGVTPTRARQYERGAREISLPELETLALFLQAPLSFFLDGESTIERDVPLPPNPAEVRARRAALGVRLRQARLAAGKTKEECARVIGRKAGTIGRYELGRSVIPITELDRLARFLQVNLQYFVEGRGADDEATGLNDLEALARLPKEVRAFALDSGNLPYLRMAMKFGDLPTDRLKELGEILLVVR